MVKFNLLYNYHFCSFLVYLWWNILPQKIRPVIVGIPGVGKTTIINHVIDLLKDQDKNANNDSSQNSNDTIAFGTVMLEEANKIGRNLVKVGTSLHEVDDTVTKFLEDSAYRKFIGHRTGHGLGMEVHEDPSVVRGNHLKLQEGMVITIEPGLYDKGNVGIRIEDNVVVTKEGHESLTILPRELIVLWYTF